MHQKVKANSIWYAQEYVKFKVEKVEENEFGTWVYYHNKSDPSQQYHCLIEAFLFRFSSYENT